MVRYYGMVSVVQHLSLPPLMLSFYQGGCQWHMYRQSNGSLPSLMTVNSNNRDMELFGNSSFGINELMACGYELILHKISLRALGVHQFVKYANLRLVAQHEELQDLW